MTDSLTSAVIPYARFVECQKRRQQVAAELLRFNPPRTIDAEVVPAAKAERPVSQAAIDKQI